MPSKEEETHIVQLERAIHMHSSRGIRTLSKVVHDQLTVAGSSTVVVRTVHMVSFISRATFLVAKLTAAAGGNEMELGTLNGQAGGYGQPASRDPNAILNECRDIDKGIDSIEQNLQRLRFLQQRAIDDPDASQNTQTNRELDALTSETMTLYRNFTKRLQNIKSQKASGEPRNAPQVGKVDRKLKNAINQYQQAESEYRRNVSAQMERQYRIVRPDASDQEVREAVEDTSNNQVFSQAVSVYSVVLMNSLIPRQLLQGNRRGQAQSALRAVQGRHEAIQKIEKQMEELAQLFAQVDEYVVQQEEQVEQIDMQGEQVVQDVNKANTELDTGIKQARSRNRKKWWCLLICSKYPFGAAFRCIDANPRLSQFSSSLLLSPLWSPL